MGRAPRQNGPGIYHVGARGVRRAAIFEDDVDYRRFEALLGDLAKDGGWIFHAWCQMPNHYHLMVETTEPDLSTGMHRLNWRFALWFNDRHGYEGHVFDRRFYSEVVESNAHFLELARYVVLNPVRARLCSHPREWRFSSYARTHTDRLMGQFGSAQAEARQRYERFVAAGVRSRRVDVPGTRTRLDQPKPYVPANRSARRRTSSAAGRPTTLR